MSLLSIEHSKLASAADVAVYTAAVAAGSVVLVTSAPATQRLALLACTVTGIMGWTAIEYGLHRFVLHGLAPFSRWHLQHHQRPTALIGAPTLLSASLITGLVFLPLLLVTGGWFAMALTLGVVIGYLTYTITHHATHHWRAESAWLQQRKRWHGRHHRQGVPAACFGVTTDFWDRVFGSRPRAGLPPR